MTDRYTELERLAREATPGPWYVNQGPRNALPHIRTTDGGRYVMDAAPRGTQARSVVRQQADAAFIAAANPAEILRLVAIARAAETALDFFTTYSSLNEGAQDDMAEEKESTLAALRLALGEKADG